MKQLKLLKGFEFVIQLCDAFLLKVLDEILMNALFMNRLNELVAINGNFIIVFNGFSALSRQKLEKDLSISFEIVREHH